jgi:long-chain acyl-CoA synthetase
VPSHPTLSSLLSDHPAAPTDPLVHAGGTSHTKLALSAMVERIAGQLDGLDRGTPVLVVGEGLDILVGLFAAWSRDLVVVPVGSRQPAAGIEALLRSCDPGAVIRGDRVTRRSGATLHPGGTAMVLWTSGTTGPPTPIVHRHDAYLEIIDRVLGPLSERRDRSRAPSPNLIPVSMALNAGIYNALFGLRAGAPLVLMDRFDTTEFATLVARHRIRSTVLPPGAIAMLNADTDLGELTPLRYVRSITAPLSPSHARRFRDRFGVAVLNGYGQTEIGEVIGWTARDARQHADRVGAVGRPHPGVSVRLLATDADGIGELAVRPPAPVSPTVAATLGDRLDDDGYVRTGDLARIDGAGFVWIEGRLGDVINRGGNKVHPTEVEELLAALPGVEDVMVAARPDGRLGEVPVAFIVGSFVPEDLEAACRAGLIPYKVPVRFEPVAAIPRNEAGKILRGRSAETRAARSDTLAQP